MLPNTTNTQVDKLLIHAYDRISLAVENTHIGFWDWDVQANKIYVEAKSLKTMGYEPDKIPDDVNFFISRAYPDDVDMIHQKIYDHLDGRTSSFDIEHRVFAKDGSVVWVQNSGRVIEYGADNKPLKVVGILYDITEKRNYKQQIVESQEKYKSIFEHINDAYCRFDFSGRIIETNHNLYDLLGITHSGLENSNVKLFFSNQAIKYLHKKLKKIISSQSLNFETDIVTPRRQVMPVSISARLITSEGGGVIQALIRDISERRLYEKALLDEKQKFKALIEHSPNVICRMNRNCKCLYISPNVSKILGIDPIFCAGKTFGEMGMPESLAKYITEKMRTVFRRNKETHFSFSLDTPKGPQYFDSIVVPESNGHLVESILLTLSDITEKIESEKELNVSRQQLAYAQTNVHFGTFVIDLVNQKVHWSNEMYAIFDRDTQLGPPSFTEFHMNLIHPDDSSFVYNTYLDAASGLNPGSNLTYQILLPDGRTKHISDYFQIEKSPETGQPTKIIGTVVDITEKKQIENRLLAERDMLQVIMDNVPDAIYFKNSDGRYLRVNEALTSLFGSCAPDDLIGKTDYDIFPKEIADAILESEQSILISGHPVINVEREFPMSYGNVWLSTTLVGVADRNGKIHQLVGISRDITAYKVSQQQLQKAKDRAEQADRLKSAFLANMSHEIRTPINGILGFANLMELREFPRNKQIEYLKIINNSGKILLNLINDIIDIAKIEAGQINVEQSAVDLHEMFAELNEFFEGERNRRAKFAIEITKVVPSDPHLRTINTDPVRLRQIISNLVNNSLKFTDRGSIEFGYVSANNYLLFFVKDSGIGMTEAETGIIFERFKQAGYKSRKQEGTGLGLAISKGLIELLGGNIWVQSKPNVGTEFFFTIPYQAVENVSIGDYVHTRFSITKDYKWDNKTLLLVEDEEVNYQYINELLESTGVNLLRVATAEEAINICKSMRNIDLILMDMRLPGLNGFDATRVIKKMRQDIPIVAQTAYAMENERRDCLDAGCDHYLTKPFDQKLLFKVLNNYLQYSN